MRLLVLSFLSACFTCTYAQTGTLDPNFGNAGLVKSNLFYAGGAATARKTFVQPDGKLRVVVQEGNRIGLMQLPGDGSFDPTYFPYSTTTNITYGDAAQDGEGKIVVAGTRNGAFALARFSEFDYFELDVNIAFPEAAVATAIAIQKDGKIVIAGYTYSSGVARFAVVRCLADGTPDSSFSDGWKTSNGQRQQRRLCYSRRHSSRW